MNPISVLSIEPLATLISAAHEIEDVISEADKPFVQLLRFLHSPPLVVTHCPMTGAGVVGAAGRVAPPI